MASVVMMSEEWRPIVGLEGWYNVSDHGNVMRIKKGKSTFIGKILKPETDSRGYQRVFPHKDGEQHNSYIHNIVAESFIGARPEGMVVNHIDGNKHNNLLDNLEYTLPLWMDNINIAEWIWAPVVEYEGLYEVCDYGYIRSVGPNSRSQFGTILKPQLDNYGYLRVGLYKGGIFHTHRIHKIVTSAFIGPCPEGKQVNHIDGNKRNNHVGNLEYVTLSENRHHAYDAGLASNYGTNNPSSKLTEEDVHEIRRVLAEGATQISVAASYGVCASTINAIVSGQNWGWLKEMEDDGSSE